MPVPFLSQPLNTHLPHRGLRVLVAFEYGTLNGGERSMLAVFDALTGRAAPVGRSSTPSERIPDGSNPGADGVKRRPTVAAVPDLDRPVEIVAAAPSKSRLAEALAERRIPRVPLELHDASGARLPKEVACERLLEAVQSVAPDVLHANSLAMGRLTGAIARRTDVPTIAHLRDILKLSGAARADLNRNSRLVAVSHATRAFHVEQGLEAGRLEVVYNGVDCDEFQPRRATGSLRRALGLPAETFLAGTIGQIGLRKGLDVLADAAALVALSVPHVHYVLVGERYSAKQESIEFEQAIVRRFESAGLGAKLHRLGYRDDVSRLLNELDVLVHPARQEPLGRVLLEAAAAGLPIIATAVGGTPEILTDGKSARLIPPGQPRPLAAAIIELAGDAGLRDRLARSARLRVQRGFSIAGAAERLAAVWRRVWQRLPPM
ncbi:MAG TPA: glycosyltransferase family 4 protein [Planctomycetaceae bacterium]|nr:glycosyltransferase family 4 protein [Planctomycetaceae bacterium]